MRVDDQIADFFVFFSELGVPDAEALARRALNLGFPPPRRSQFVATIQSDAAGGHRTLTDFFAAHGDGARTIGQRLGFSHGCVNRYQQLARRLAGEGDNDARNPRK